MYNVNVLICTYNSNNDHSNHVGADKYTTYNISASTENKIEAVKNTC